MLAKLKSSTIEVFKLLETEDPHQEALFEDQPVWVTEALRTKFLSPVKIGTSKFVHVENFFNKEDNVRPEVIRPGDYIAHDPADGHVQSMTERELLEDYVIIEGKEPATETKTVEPEEKIEEAEPDQVPEDKETETADAPVKKAASGKKPKPKKK